MSIDVVVDTGKFNRDVWIFHLFDLNAVLVGFRSEEKPPRKQKWRLIDVYDKYGKSTILEPISIPKTVKEEVFLQIKNQIKIRTWKKWENK